MSEHAESPQAPFSELVPLAPSASARPPVTGPWTARLWDQALGYLPVLLMGVLAALSWWLVKNTPVPADPSRAATLRHEPDYTMQDFSVVSYRPDGVLQSRLEGDRLRHFPDNDTIEVDGVRLRSVDAAGRVVVGSAQRALSNGDATQVRLTGGATVVREPGPRDAPTDRLEIRGEFIEIFTETERVRSHLPVVLITGRGEMRAGSLDYNHVDRTGQLGGRVVGELRATPRPAP
ncbi:LPS export ABC transporter periplasmic protein LptC [uncultured Methylibium sp.]|uniref:LPS export ABC transporter periplasmic protein LptC n=1 Tax=uncultured Methylibium sp. TaxID=381093 RepID=UPI0025D510F9|nr:LPS export ABC transporter periplasmic protein LptC [uncultured Methylibium sp.]